MQLCDGLNKFLEIGKGREEEKEVDWNSFHFFHRGLQHDCYSAKSPSDCFRQVGVVKKPDCSTLP